MGRTAKPRISAGRKSSTRVRLDDLTDVHDRCAGIDVHEQSVTVCISTGKGQGELREYAAATGGLRELKEWFRQAGVTHAVMESTGIYWQPVWQIPEDDSYQLLLANARHVRNMPGRKTDGEDAIWLATLLRKGQIRGSFIPPADVRALRDLCRTRANPAGDRAGVSQRVEKILEQANIKLDTVVTDIMGVSSRRMIEELPAGETDRARIAELALGAMRTKIPQLQGSAGRISAAASAHDAPDTVEPVRFSQRRDRGARGGDRDVCAPFCASNGTTGPDCGCRPYCRRHYHRRDRGRYELFPYTRTVLPLGHDGSGQQREWRKEEVRQHRQGQHLVTPHRDSDCMGCHADQEQLLRRPVPCASCGGVPKRLWSPSPIPCSVSSGTC